MALWNADAQEMLRPGWLNCLDESMPMWNSKISCPGWFFCPCKPHPFCNEHRAIGCAESGAMCGIELVEGKGRLKELGKQKGDEIGPTVGLLMRLTKLSHAAGEVVALDSGFCVLQDAIELKKLGAFVSALIKKRRF